MSIQKVTVAILGVGGTVRAEQDTADSSLALHHVLESDGVAVAAGHPLPVADATVVTALGFVASATGQASVLTQATASATALGVPGDAAWSGSGSGSIAAILKALWTALTGTLKTTPPTLAYTQSTSGSVSTASGTLVSAAAYLRSLTITTPPNSTGNVWLNPTGGPAVVGAGVLVAAGGGSFSFGGPAAPMPTAAITAIADSAGTTSVALAGG